MESREYLLLIGPNRRSEKTIIERQWLLSDDELLALDGNNALVRARLREWLLAHGVQTDGRLEAGPVPKTESGREAAYALFAELYNGTALSLQRAAGHRVGESGFHIDRSGGGVWPWFEYEHDDAGYQASALAVRMLAEAEPVLQLNKADRTSEHDLETQFREFLAMARPLVLPLDTEALVDAALRLDVPCVKLERDPYEGVKGDFRIRPNGLLQMGHCRHQETVDGTFCVTRNAAVVPLIRDRGAMARILDELQVPVPRTDPDTPNCIMSKRAIRAAGRIGYPVVVKSGVRQRGAGVTLDVRDESNLRAAVEKSGRLGNQVLLEAMVGGNSTRVLVAGMQVLAGFRNGQVVPAHQLPQAFSSLASRIAARLGCGMVVVDVVADGDTPEDGKFVVVDVDCAPELDRLLPEGSAVFEQAAEAFVRWLFPKPLESRIPIIGITGTNGKTTTCRMTTRIMKRAGYYTGMVCSDGIYLDEKFQITRSDIGHGAHHHVFEDRNIELAVFEEYFGRIARLGFSYSWCNVAVCTNVTPDHLGRIGVHDLDQMAELKLAMPLRARDGVVLNADDERCVAMVKHVHAKQVWLASRRKSRHEVESLVDRAVCACVIEKIDGEDGIVMYAGGERLTIAAINAIPATFNGTAAHNIDNAMYAACAGYVAGADARQIRDGLVSFVMAFETAPGRLNVYEGLPYRVVMDYAHNLDGFARICHFVDQQQVAGRKLLMVGFSGDRRDAEIVSAAGSLAGHFDHYVCRNFRYLRKRQPHEVPALMKSGLLAAGVGESAISIVENFDAAVHHALDVAQPGDLVVLLVGSTEFQSIWELLHRMGEAAAQGQPFSTVASESTK